MSYITAAAIATGASLALALALFRSSNSTKSLRKHTAFFGPKLNNGKPFVVFLIGSRVNNWRAVFSSPRTLMQFGMFAVKSFEAADVKKGMLHEERYGNPITGSVIVQYWASFDDLMEFGLKNPEHSESFKQYYQAVDRNQMITIWHETYVVQDYECVYNNTHPIHLAAVPGVELVEIQGREKIHLKHGKERLEEARKYM
jgi:hypothetical protein